MKYLQQKLYKKCQKYINFCGGIAQRFVVPTHHIENVNPVQTLNDISI